MNKLILLIALFPFVNGLSQDKISDLDQVRYLTSLKTENLEAIKDTVIFFAKDNIDFCDKNYSVRLGNKIFQSNEPFRKKDIEKFYWSDSLKVVSDYFKETKFIHGDKLKVDYYLMGDRKKIDIFELDKSKRYKPVKSINCICFSDEKNKDIQLRISNIKTKSNEVVKLSSSDWKADYEFVSKNFIRQIVMLNDFKREKEIQAIARYFMKASYL